MAVLTVAYTDYVGSDWAKFYADGVLVYEHHPEDFWYEAAYWVNKLGGLEAVVEVVDGEEA